VDDCVHPGAGGMSVAPRAEALPPHRLSRRLRDKYPDRFPDASGSNNVNCWSMGSGTFSQGRVARRLCLRLDPRHPETHGFVEPDATMKTADFEAAVAATRDQWRRWEE
jgi:hypothetical protein